MRNVMLGLLCLVWLLVCAGGCQKLQVNTFKERLRPSNQRDWIAEMATTPYAEVDGQNVTLHNVRDNDYATNDDYVVNYSDRTIALDQIQSVDYIVIPFNNAPAIAHTMLSFGLDDGTYFCLSVEVRREKGEGYSAWKGFTRQLEINYVIAEEQDLIGVRTSQRDSEVYVYPTVATSQQAQALFKSVVTRMNKLAVEPEFYNTITNNCTTNLKQHVNELSPDRIPYAWKILLPAYSAKYAYDLGLLDNRVPFEDLQVLARVNDESNDNVNNPRYSQLIRQKQQLIERVASRKADTINN